MTQDQKIIRAKVGLLELAMQLGNMSLACRAWRMGAVRKDHRQDRAAEAA